MDVQTQGSLYEFFCRVFQHEPDAALIEGLRALGSTGDEGLDAYLDATAQQDADELAHAVAADFSRLFLGMSAHPVAPYESVYLSDLHLLMQEPRDRVVAAYRAEGFGVRDDFGLPEDHLAVELAFMAQLCARVESERAAGNEQGAERLLNAGRSFVEEHLARWVPLFADEVQRREEARKNTPSFYAACARMLAGFIEDARADA